MGEGELSENKRDMEILEYENSPKRSSFRAVAAVNPLATSGKSSPDDIAKEAGPETVEDDYTTSESSDEDLQ